MNINVLNLYPSNRINALHSIKVEDIQPSLVYPGLEEVVQSIQQARPVENLSNSNVQVARPPSTSTSNNSTPNRVRRSRAPSAPVSLTSASIKASSAAIFRKSNQKSVESAFKTPEELEKDWLKSISNAKTPAEEAQLISSYLQQQITDTSTPFGQLVHNFVKAKFREKAEQHRVRDAHLMNQMSAKPDDNDQLVDLRETNASPPTSMSSSLSASMGGNETAQTFVDDLVATISRRHRLLRTNSTRIAVVTATVEQILYAEILKLYQKTFASRDEALEKKTRQLLTLSLAHLGVPQRLWLVSPDVTAPPYDDAIATLKQLPNKATPAAKLRVMVDSCAAIGSAVTAHANANDWPENDKILTADLLLPLLTYVVVRAGVPLLYSCTRFLEDFISESDEIHEEGYTLATFQTCLAVIEQIDAVSMGKSVSDIFRKTLEDGDNIIIQL